MKNWKPPRIELGDLRLKLSVLYHLSYSHRVTASLHNSQYHSVCAVCVHISPGHHSLPFTWHYPLSPSSPSFSLPQPLPNHSLHVASSPSLLPSPITCSNSLPSISWHSGGLFMNSFMTAVSNCSFTTDEASSEMLVSSSSNTYGVLGRVWVHRQERGTMQVRERDTKKMTAKINFKEGCVVPLHTLQVSK